MSRNVGTRASVKNHIGIGRSGIDHVLTRSSKRDGEACATRPPGCAEQNLSRLLTYFSCTAGIRNTLIISKWRRGIYALADVVAVHPYPLAPAGRRLFDDRPSVNVDVCRGGDAAPEDSVRVRGIEGHRRHKRRDSNAAQEKYAHNRIHWLLHALLGGS
jgi:hypothetical protein